MVRLIVVAVALVAAMGGFIYGFDSGIVATTLGHDSFKRYFYGLKMSNSALSGTLATPSPVDMMLTTYQGRLSLCTTLARLAVV